MHDLFNLLDHISEGFHRDFLVLNDFIWYFDNPFNFIRYMSINFHDFFDFLDTVNIDRSVNFNKPIYLLDHFSVHVDWSVNFNDSLNLLDNISVNWGLDFYNLLDFSPVINVDWSFNFNLLDTISVNWNFNMFFNKFRSCW